MERNIFSSATERSGKEMQKNEQITIWNAKERKKQTTVGTIHGSVNCCCSSEEDPWIGWLKEGKIVVNVTLEKKRFNCHLFVAKVN